MYVRRPVCSRMGIEIAFWYLFLSCYIMQFTQAHKSMYAIYCSNYDSAEAYVARLKKRKDLEQALIVGYHKVI